MFPYCTNQPNNFETDREWVRILAILGVLLALGLRGLFICLKGGAQHRPIEQLRPISSYDSQSLSFRA